uniref:Reverse transcriptase domain-containing protein n=1 Tax=Cuerna arida TaxID=1464854 RepID=A0A1B6EI60_9HEMI
MYIAGVYRSPSGNLDNAIEILSDALDTIPTWKCPTVIMGDINVDNLSQDNRKLKLGDMLARHNLHRLDLPPTRVTNRSKTSIDFVCTNLNPSEITTKVINTGLSDHTAQLCIVSLQNKKSPPPSSSCRQFTQDNLVNFRHTLASETWQTIYGSLSTNEAYDNFNHILTRTLNATCPQKTSRPKTKLKFKATDAESQKLRKDFLCALELEKTSGKYEDKARTAAKKKDYDLYLKKLRKQSTSDYIKNSENKQKAIWKVINYERCNDKSKTEPLKLLINDNLIEDPHLVAEQLNQHFVSVAENTLVNSGQVSDCQPSTWQDYGNIPDLILYPTTQTELLKTISSIKSKPSAGVDEFPSFLIKHCKEEIASPFSHIINLSFSQGIFPDKLKIAKVYPKFKKGITTSVENYRPISILSTFSKLIELILLNRLMEHLINHNIITNQQHGFLKGRSTTTAIAQLTEHIIDQLENGLTVTALLLDFSKAFDCLNHDLLITKAQSMGIRGISKKWLSSYLKNRQQQVEVSYKNHNLITKVRSTPLTMTRGVPQGSVLGPILFILLTNDFPNYIQCYAQTMLYADDTSLLIANKDPNSIEIDSFIALNMAKQYCQQNDLVLNENKTQQLFWTGRRELEPQGLPDITPDSETKYLGITIDNRLSWNPHIDDLCSKLNSSLYALKRIKNTCDLQTSRTAYFSLFESHIRYGLIVWGNSSEQNRQKILVLQKKALRILDGLNAQDSCRQAFKKHNILTVVSLYIMETICFTVSRKPDHLGATHTYHTRHAADFTLPTHHLTLYEKKPSYIGSKLFNLLPDDLKRHRDDRFFKNQLKSWLLQTTYYSMEEFCTWRNT